MDNENQPPINGHFLNPPRTLSNPQALFAPLTYQFLGSIAGPTPDFQQNHSNNSQQSSQIGDRIDGYESRIRQLNQEIQLHKWWEQQKLSFLEAKCTELNCQLLKKGSELDELKSQSFVYSLVSGQEKRDLGAHCAKLNGELLKKGSELEALKANHQAELNQLYVELQQCNLKLAKAKGENLELKVSNLKHKRGINSTLARDKTDVEPQCAELNDELLKLDSELKALKANIQAERDCKETELHQLNQKLSNAEDTNSDLTEQFRYTIEKLEETEHRLSCTTIYNQKLKKENETLRADHSNLDRCKSKLRLEKSKNRQLQAEVESREAKLQVSSQKLRKIEEENSELAQKSTANNLQTELDNQTSKLQNCKDRQKKADEEYFELNFQNKNLKDELDQKKKEMLTLQKLSNKTKTELDTCRADLEKSRDDINRMVDERDSLKVELESASANSWELKAELELSKKSIEEPTIKLEKLKAECQRPSNLSVLKAQPRNVCRSPLNLPWPSSVISAVKRTTVDLNATIVPKSIEELKIKLKAECQSSSNLSVLKAQPQNVRKPSLFPFVNLPGPSSVMTAAKRTTVDLNSTIGLNDAIDLTKTMSSSKKKIKLT